MEYKPANAKFVISLPFKMADVAQHVPDRVGSPCSNWNADEFQTDSRESPVPLPHPKEVPSMQYDQRQKCELKRLLKHTCPELRGLGNALEEEFADILNSDITTENGYQGDIQARRLLFENGSVNNGESKEIQERIIQGEQTSGQVLSCFQDDERSSLEPNTTPHKQSEPLNAEENFRVDVKATRKMFEGHSTPKDTLEDTFLERLVMADEAKGVVLKQKKDFETFYNDPDRRNSPFSIADITEQDQDPNEVYQGISKAKEIFETGFVKENTSSAIEHLVGDDETSKTSVRNRTQMFESTPLDRINWQKEEESDCLEERMCKTLISLFNFNVIQSQGMLLEATEAGHIRKANYVLGDERPEIQQEEVIMGSVKSILLQILAKVNLNPHIALLKEDEQGNVEVKSVDVPTHHLPFTVNQDKEYRTTVTVQVIEDLLGQETCPGKGVLIQEHELGAVKIVVYVLFRRDVHDGKVLSMMESKDINDLFGNDDENPCTSNPSLFQIESSCHDRLEGNGNVKLLRSRIENGELDSLRSLQKSPSDEGLHQEENVGITSGHLKTLKAIFTTNPDSGTTSEEFHNPIPESLSTGPQNCLSDEENEKENLIIPHSNLKTLKAMFTPNPDSGTTSEEFHNPVQEMLTTGPQKCLLDEEVKENVVVPASNLKTLKAMFTPNPDNSGTVKTSTHIPKRIQETVCIPDLINESSQKAKPSFDSVFLTELAPTGEVLLESNLEESMKSPHQATTEARTLQHSFQENQEDTFPSPPDDQYLTEFMSEGYISETESVLSSETGQQDGNEKSSKGSVQSALDSLGKSSFNVTKGDFKAAMIYKNSGRKTAEVKACSPSFTTEQVTIEKHQACQGQSANKPSACSPPTSQTQLMKNEMPRKSKPAIPPKPDHLKMIPPHQQARSGKPEEQHGEPAEHRDDLKAEQSQVTTEQEGQRNQNGLSVGPEFHASLQNFGVKTSPAVPPVKPKRLKMVTDNTHQPSLLYTSYKQHADEGEHETQPGSIVTMREKKGRQKESEAERRQRLSVHMDEIIRENASAAMEIIDKLRKQDELKSILLKVEEIEEDAGQEHETDIRKIFESVPDWVVPNNHTASEDEVEKKVVGNKVETVSESEVLSSMQVAFGDLEKASVAINNLKEQTLTRLMEIEETIKKALYSVSTLKSDSDIVGLSGLFKESMISGQLSPVSGNVRKISIGSSKSIKAQTSSKQDISQVERSKSALSPPVIKPRAGSPSSPSFISIQSTARKNPEKPQTSTNNVLNPNEKRQVSTLEVKTGPKNETVIGTKTIREKYEEMDCYGNKFFSSKTSTVVTTQADTKSCFTGQLGGDPIVQEVVFPRMKTTPVTGNQSS